MFPLKNKPVSLGYRFGQPTSYSNFHLGTDYIVPVGTEVLAPFDGQATRAPFKEGGNVINFICTVDGQNYIMRFMHLQEYRKLAMVREGDVIGLTGNSGTQTTEAHLHLDISRNHVDVGNDSNFVNPETFNWKGENPMDAHTEYLAGVVLGTEPQGVYLKPDGNAAVLTHCKSEDQVRALLHLGDNDAIPYQKVESWQVGGDATAQGKLDQIRQIVG